jgi:hypothetical protein
VLFALLALALAGSLFLCMLGLLEVGRRIGARRFARDAEHSRSGGVMDGSVFGLLGLLLAFTFSGAASRFDHRRNQIVDEANAIGTAWLRIDLLPREAQPAIRDGFRRYVDARLGAYRKLPDVAAAKQELARAHREQEEVWARTVELCRTDAGLPARMLLLPAMNEMFDIANSRTMAARMHPPGVIYGMLAAVALVAATLAGYAMAGAGKQRSLLHMVCFAGTIAIAVYVILEIEYPRQGLVRLGAFDQAMVDVRADMR